MRFLLLLYLFLGFGCTQNEPSVPQPGGVGATDAPASGNTFLSLGDSYTIGEGVPSADRWSVQLARTAGLAPPDIIARTGWTTGELQQAIQAANNTRTYDLAPPDIIARTGWTTGELQQAIQAANNTRTYDLAPPDIIARTGWTTGELQQAIQAANNTRTYDLVSLLIGVNNQYRRLPLASYRTEFRELLHTATRFAGNRPGRVFVLSIPDWGRSPYGQHDDPARIAAEIDQFNAVARAECQQAGIAYVDITDLTRAAADDASQFAPDGLHYSGRQMQQWAARALPAVKGLLR
ncbi:SGNH/GDSL hydrolase family protein [Hymenobacter aquaticus]|uniref:SGNH/GDSL hydrolase family protein n=1 Tax=Hymenobacter aquaticus TaxID=1867101 RepID=A0A4Z0PZ08_9BACT|nr:GDSL-type esterase/lipase family protein [Hymenobacter aquaticus]TGE22141.1 SGNH/GDSL hydrolase family protein [Hymenobacter aquaticus]